ncbi:MAG TPA: IS200/IS605 family transposase [Planctomycetota bacterium]|nr:IS200/IS605 family transposase [Planctomycetota bacterium]
MSYTNLLYHVVFSTKERLPRLREELRPRIWEYIGGIIRNVEGHLLAANGTLDHVHLACVGSPKIAVAKLVQFIKGSSSKWMHETFPELGDAYWQQDYAAFTVSPSTLPNLLAYIRDQEEHHKRVDFKQEFIALLKRHGISYDERYLWR